MQRAEDRSQRDYVLDPPIVKRLEHVSKKNEMYRYPLGHWAELGYLAHVPLQEIRTHDSIFRVSLIEEMPVSKKMEVTDS